MRRYTEYYPAWNFSMYLDWARAIEEYQPLVTEEHQKRVCSHPAGDKSTALDLFENDVTGCLDTVFLRFWW